jgi:methylated-DNA-protein-cysteine methyltransferase-like protein
VPSFERRVLAVLRSLQPGEVVTYGVVARDAGFPNEARAVGNLLRMTDQDVPWWRVVTAEGRLVPGFDQEQAARLRAEGITVVDAHVRPRPGRTAPATRRSPTRRTGGR